MTCRVLWDYSAAEADELSLRRGETVVVERKDDGGWWFGHVASNPKRSGLFPGCYVRNQEEEDPATVPEPKNEPIERTMMNSRKATKLASSVTQDDDDDGACRSSETRDDILETMLELEARTAAAEASLAEERRVADAFRAAAMGSLELLENILSRILKPLPGIVLETPDDDGYSEDDVRVLQHGETSNTLGEQLALLVANQMGSKVKQINSCQRGVSWADFCDSLEACFEKELAARQFGSKDNVLAAHATTVAAQISHVPSREDFVDARGPKTELPPRAARLRPRVGPAAAIGNEYQCEKMTDESRCEYNNHGDNVDKVLGRYASPLHELFQSYANVSANGVEIKSRRSRADTEVFVSPADFLRLCRDYDICTTLLSRQEATTICRLSLTMAKKCDRERTLAPAGLNEAQLHRALTRCAVAAYAHMPTTSLCDKLDALFLHMGLEKPGAFSRHRNHQQQQPVVHRFIGSDSESSRAVPRLERRAAQEHQSRLLETRRERREREKSPPPPPPQESCHDNTARSVFTGTTSKNHETRNENRHEGRHNDEPAPPGQAGDDKSTTRTTAQFLPPPGAAPYPTAVPHYPILHPFAAPYATYLGLQAPPFTVAPTFGRFGPQYPSMPPPSLPNVAPVGDPVPPR